MRWLTPFLFLPGILCTILNLPGASQTLIILSIISMILCFLLISQLSRPIEKTLWAWVILFVFIFGYYAKYFFMSASLISDDLGFFNIEMSWLNQEILTQGLWWSCIGFWMYCVTASILLFLQKKKPYSSRKISFHQLKDSPRLQIFLISFYMLSLIMPFGSIYFGFGQMGVEHNKLPFRLDAFITHFNMTLVPIVSLMLLWLTDDDKHRKYWWLVMVIFISLIVLNSITRTSRSGLLLATIPIFFLWLLTAKLTPKRKTFVLLMVMTTFILYPFFSMLRMLRVQNMSLSVVDFNYLFNDLYFMMKNAIYSILTRVSGMDGLIHNIYYGTPTFIDLNRLSWLLDIETMGIYQTYEVVGIPYGVIEGRSPGLLGAFALVGGLPGIIVLVPVYTIIVWSIWNLMSNLKIRPVALAFLGSALLMYTSEGGFGIQAPITWGVGLVMATVIFKIIAYNKRPLLTLKENFPAESQTMEKENAWIIKGQ